MSEDFSKYANIGVQSLKPYSPGKPMSELERELGLSNIIKLASNENPLGCSAKAITAVKDALKEIALYPDGNGFELKEALGIHLNIGSKRIILGNGSNDILELVARAFLNETRSAVFSEYAFAVYPLAVQAVGAQAKIAKARDWAHDLKAMLELIDESTAVVFIANPNNPTGTYTSNGDLQNFLDQVPKNILVVLDEAYYEYVDADVEDYPDGIKLLAKYPNLLVTRTFSKAYGLAGFRVGYGLASETITDILNRVRQPFNVNSLALAAATAALEDQNFILESVSTNREGLSFLENELAQLNLEFITSVANFIAIKFGDNAEAINQSLLKKGIIVRPLASYKMPDYLRVTVGTAEENQIFIETLKEIL